MCIRDRFLTTHTRIHKDRHIYRGIMEAMEMGKPSVGSSTEYITDNVRYYCSAGNIDRVVFEDLITIRTAHSNSLYQVIKVTDNLIASNGADNRICLTNIANPESPTSEVVSDGQNSSCMAKCGDYVMSGNNAHLMIWKFNHETQKLTQYYKAEFSGYGFVRSVEPVNIAEDENHVVVGFNAGQIVVYNLDSKKTLCETKTSHVSPRFDVFYNSIMKSLIHVSSAWFDQTYLTVHTINPETKEIKELLKFDEDFKIQRVKSVIIRDSKCVVYGGNKFLGIYNVDEKQRIAKVPVSEVNSCSALSLVGFNITDFLILFYNNCQLQVFRYKTDEDEIKFIDRLSVKEKMHGNYTNSCCLWIMNTDSEGIDIVVAKHDDSTYNGFSKLKITFGDE
eukprot:TRINITY_DN8449_c0_g1_i7.p1 TRINITY_DN8449_c0_g1~~TRINITY_DN8449_c0_g1_i7.p1  ORF type:complete len:392 (-),score=72.67 TRINITY_DN8449_c0_g1_i7:251-1426(-)